MLRYRMKKPQSGFSLIELLVVLVIMGMLAGLVGPRLFGKVDSSKVRTADTQVKMLKTALQTYRLDVGTYPTSEQGLASLISKPQDVKYWNGPYLDKELMHQITKGEYQDLNYTSNANWTCDIDGDGNRDGAFLVYRADRISDEVAKKISNIIDGDGDITEGDKRWQAAGKVKRYGTNSDHRHVLLYCLN